MPKQIFQRPAHITRSKGGKFSGPAGQQDWSRKKKSGTKKPTKGTQAQANSPSPGKAGK